MPTADHTTMPGSAPRFSSTNRGPKKVARKLDIDLCQANMCSENNDEKLEYNEIRAASAYKGNSFIPLIKCVPSPEVNSAVSFGLLMLFPFFIHVAASCC